MDRTYLVGSTVDVITYDEATAFVIGEATAGRGGYVCACNVHMIMEAHDDETFRDVLAGADIVTADGMPIVWAQRLFGHRGATRVYGPELALRICARAAANNIRIGLYGGTEATLERLANQLSARFPSLNVVLAVSPPFRPLTPEEDLALVQQVRESGAAILLVGLGCPKQEFWMAAHKGVVPAIMVGVGAAFDFIAGTKPQAPRWMQQAGLEWLFRLATEPKRLWYRYLYHNPRFVALTAKQLVATRLFGTASLR